MRSMKSTTSRRLSYDLQEEAQETPEASAETAVPLQTEEPEATGGHLLSCRETIHLMIEDAAPWRLVVLHAIPCGVCVCEGFACNTGHGCRETEGHQKVGCKCRRRITLLRDVSQVSDNVCDLCIHFATLTEGVCLPAAPEGFLAKARSLVTSVVSRLGFAPPIPDTVPSDSQKIKDTYWEHHNEMASMESREAELKKQLSQDYGPDGEFLTLRDR